MKTELSLKQLRDEWEKNCEVIVCLAITVLTYEIIIVCVRSLQKNNHFRFTVLRYFPLLELKKWSVSVDFTSKSLSECKQFIFDSIKENLNG